MNCYQLLNESLAVWIHNQITCVVSSQHSEIKGKLQHCKGR